MLRRGYSSFVLLFGLLMLGLSGVAQSTATPAASTSGSGTAKSGSAKHATTKKPTAKHKSTHQTSHASSRSSRVAHTARIKQAFVASKELEPMAQQLATMRTPEAYTAVTAYAHSHTGEAAAAAYLALGHAYLLDKRYACLLYTSRCV